LSVSPLTLCVSPSASCVYRKVHETATFSSASWGRE
jgi:hypothetical protein